MSCIIRGICGALASFPMFGLKFNHFQYKSMFPFFKALSVARNGLRPESAPLRNYELVICGSIGLI